MSAPATNPLSYNAYVQQIGVMAVVQTQNVSGVQQFVDAAAQTALPQMLNYAELRIQRDLDISKFGLEFDFCNRVNASNNAIAGIVTANINSVSPSGDLVLTGTTGFPRSGAGSPNGSVTSFYMGEQYFDTAGSHWWAASSFNTTVWTQLSN
jgi:hypothetical protein